jgi:thiaminase/transcriptional activator TenA
MSRLRPDVPDYWRSNGKRTSPRNFAGSLFNSPFSRRVREAVLETAFFKKMMNNTLSPEEYGGYMVQDAAYMFEGIKAFDVAAKNMEERSQPEFASFYRNRSACYKRLSRSYFTSKWKIQSPDCLILDPAASTYIAYEMGIAKKSPKYLAIAILPCEMLWPWLAAQIDRDVSSTNIYRSWVDRNLPTGHGLSTTEKFVNKFFTSRKETRNSVAIFNQAMINELNFFRSACGERPLDI